MPVDVSSYNVAPSNALDRFSTVVGAAQGMQTLKQQQLDYKQDQLSSLRGQLSSLITKQNLSMSDFQDLAVNGVKEGIWTASQAATELAGIKDTSPEGLRGTALQFLSTVMTAQERINMQYGVPTTVNDGSMIRQIAVSPVTGTRELGPGIPVQMSPSELAAPAQIGVTPEGQGVTGTTRQFIERADPGMLPGNALEGAAAGVAPGAPGAAVPGAPPAGNRLGATAPEIVAPPMVVAQPEEIAPNTDVAQMVAGPEGGGIVTALPPGATEAQRIAAEQGAEQAGQLLTASNRVPEQRAILEQMEDLVDDFEGGPGADDWKGFKVFANTVSPFGDIFDPAQIASQEEFAKLSYQLAQQQFQALGGTGTDSQLDSTMQTSPNTFLSNLGNEGILDLLRGNLDAMSAKAEAWQDGLASGKYRPDQFFQFSRDFQQHFDPRVFVTSYQDGEERAEMLKGMSKTEKARFLENYRYALEQGWVSLPEQSPGAR